MGAPFTLAQLLTPATEPQIRAQFLALLQGNGLPALSEWASNPNGLEMAFVKMVSQAVNDLLHSGAPVPQRLAAIAGSRTLKYAAGDWLTFVAASRYLVERNPATKTTFRMKLSSVALSPYTFQVGDVVLVAPSGNHYISTAGGALSPGGSLELPFEAADVGSAFADNPAVVRFQLGTVFAGVSVAPGGGDFTDVVHGGGSVGQLLPRRTSAGTQPLAHTFAIRIDASGNTAAATWSLATDAGPFVAQGILAASIALPGGTSFTAINGPGSPSFLQGDVFVFSTPGTPRFVQGQDAESDLSLIARCLARWPGLSPNVLTATVVLWAALAYPPANRVQVTPDQVVPGRFVLSVADSHGAVDQVAVNTIAAFIRPKLDTVIGEDVLVQSATTLAVVTAGSVQVGSATIAAVQATAQALWTAYLQSVPMGGVVRLSRLIEILMDAGAVDAGAITPLTLNGSAANLQLATGQVPVDGNTNALAGALTWIFA